MSHGNLHLAWCELLFAALRDAGVRDVVVSPGSRSTPLVLSAARTEGLTLHTIVDERAAGFFALGQSRLSGRPTALLCTSGTAPAHYLPAVIEAAQSHVPLLVVSADRPWEAQDCASPQTVDQTALFGHHLRHRAELGEPDPSALRAVGRIGAQCVLATRWPVPGPVQLNARFRKPLEPVDVPTREPWRDELDALRARGAPKTFTPAQTVPPATIEALAARCRASARGLIACGPMPVHGADALRDAVFALSRATGFAVLAEATSQCRFGAPGDGLSGADVFLRDPAFRARMALDVIFEVGAPLTSGAWPSLLDAHPRAERVVIAPYGWNDPRGDATHMVFGDPAAVLSSLAETLHREGAAPSTVLRASLAQADAIAREGVSEELSSGALTEGFIAHAAVASLAPGDVLMLGNSMPVRDVDTYAAASNTPLAVLHQRGASGIDGLIAGAAGARSVSDGAVLLLLGDVSFAHDLGGLNAAARAERPLVIVVVQNEGGRIFGELPIAQRKELGAVFDAHFTTVQALDLSHACAQFAIDYTYVSRPDALRDALTKALATPGCTVIEAMVPPDDASARRRRLWDRTRERLGELPRPGMVALTAPGPCALGARWVRAGIGEQRPVGCCEPSSAARRNRVCTVPAPRAEAPSIASVRSSGPRGRRPSPSRPHEPATRVVCLHGFLGAPSMWTPVTDASATRATLPGHGPEPWMPDGDFDAITDAFATRIGLTDRVMLVGYSMGARLALSIALQRPEAVARLVLIGVDPGMRDDAQRAERVRWEEAQAALVARVGMADFVAQWEALPVFATQRALDERTRQRRREARMAHTPEGIAWAMRALGTGSMPSYWGRLSALAAKTLLVTGGRDEKFTAIARDTGLAHRVVDNAGHDVALEAPEALAAVLARAQTGANDE